MRPYQSFPIPSFVSLSVRYLCLYEYMKVIIEILWHSEFTLQTYIYPLTDTKISIYILVSTCSFDGYDGHVKSLLLLTNPSNFPHVFSRILTT